MCVSHCDSFYNYGFKIILKNISSYNLKKIKKYIYFIKAVVRWIFVYKINKYNYFNFYKFKVWNAIIYRYN
jgi:hypothetical protein